MGRRSGLRCSRPVSIMRSESVEGRRIVDHDLPAHRVVGNLFAGGVDRVGVIRAGLVFVRVRLVIVPHDALGICLDQRPRHGLHLTTRREVRRADPVTRFGNQSNILGLSLPGFCIGCDMWMTATRLARRGKVTTQTIGRWTEGGRYQRHERSPGGITGSGFPSIPTRSSMPGFPAPGSSPPLTRRSGSSAPVIRTGALSVTLDPDSISGDGALSPSLSWNELSAGKSPTVSWMSAVHRRFTRRPGKAIDL